MMMMKAAEPPPNAGMESGSVQTSPLSLKQYIKQGIKRLYQQQELCDVTLVAEGKRFPCHRTLLASVSLYFQRMFSSTFRESRESEIVLMDLPATSLQTLLGYVYTGALPFQEQEAEELFAAASRLQIASALEVITRFFRGRISVWNCLELYVLAHSHNHRPLLRPASHHVAIHFDQISEFPAFQALDFSVLMSIIVLDSLAVESEMIVYRAVRRWVMHRQAERLPKLPFLMDQVRLALLSPKELVEVRAEMEESYESVCLPWEELSVEERLWASRGLRRGMYHDGVVCVGLPKWSAVNVGDEELDSHVHFFDPSVERWEQLPDLKTLTSPSCVSVGHKLYITGGQRLDGSYSDALQVYDTIGSCWTQLPSMSAARAGHAFLVCRKKLYVASGWDITGSLVCAESYDLVGEEWAPIASLPFALTYFSSLALRGKLYLIGGEMGDSEVPIPHRGFLVYDVGSSQWTEVPVAFEFYEASVLALGHSILVIGGLVGDGSPEGRRFTPRCLCLGPDGAVRPEVCVPPLPIAISYPGVVRWRKRIYVFGGDSYDRYSSAIHYWEVGQESWTRCAADLPDPNYGAFGFGCMPLKVPRRNILSVFHRGSTPNVAET